MQNYFNNVSISLSLSFCLSIYNYSFYTSWQYAVCCTAFN